MEMLLLGIEVFPVSLILTLMLTGTILPYLARARAGQMILEIGPAWHKVKEGTPTMGGIAPLLAILLSTTLFACILHGRSAVPLSPWLLTMLFALANAGIGIVDDLTKLRHKENRGLSPLQKLALQSAVATAYLLLLQIWEVCTTDVAIPFTGRTLSLGWLWYPLFFFFTIWFVNCANLTDGIDGLASSVSALIGVFYFAIAAFSGNVSLGSCSAALVGGALGFLAFNRHPARIFMGDTGSLFFGGMIVGCSMLSGSPLTLPLTAIVFLLEGLSVVLQVVYFKFSHGKRLFRMAPLHHHLEKCGISEWGIVLSASLLTLLFSLISFVGATYGGW